MNYESQEWIVLICSLGFIIMNAEQLKDRFKQFAYRTVKVCESLSQTTTSQIIAKQLLRSAFSSAANYRSAKRAQSKKTIFTGRELLQTTASSIRSVLTTCYTLCPRLPLMQTRTDVLIRILDMTGMIRTFRRLLRLTH